MGAEARVWGSEVRDDAAQLREERWESSGVPERWVRSGDPERWESSGDPRRWVSPDSPSDVIAEASGLAGGSPDAPRRTPGATQADLDSDRRESGGQIIAESDWDCSAGERQETHAGASYSGRNPLRPSFPPARFPRVALRGSPESTLAPGVPNATAGEDRLVHRDTAPVGLEAARDNLSVSRPSEDLIVWIRLPGLEGKLDSSPLELAPQRRVPRAPLPWRHMSCRSPGLVLSQGLAMGRRA